MGFGLLVSSKHHPLCSERHLWPRLPACCTDGEPREQGVLFPRGSGSRAQVKWQLWGMGGLTARDLGHLPQKLLCHIWGESVLGGYAALLSGAENRQEHAWMGISTGYQGDDGTRSHLRLETQRSAQHPRSGPGREGLP